jgi:hypothetical protein
MMAKPIYIASWPRSGNTLLRTYLRQCFGLRSTSVYPNDLGGNRELEQIVGHVDYRKPTGKHFIDRQPWHPIKTHELAKYWDETPTIYIRRDPRPACVSLWHYYGQQLPLEVIAAGNSRFGHPLNHWESWRHGGNVVAWLSFDDLVKDQAGTVSDLADALGIAPLANWRMPTKAEMNTADSRYIPNAKPWQDYWTDECERAFTRAMGRDQQAVG